MKIEVHISGGPDLVIPVPNAILFSPKLLNWELQISGLSSSHTIPEIPPETVKKACAAIKEYRKDHGPWEIVRVESADGQTVIITV